MPPPKLPHPPLETGLPTLVEGAGRPRIWLCSATADPGGSGEVPFHASGSALRAERCPRGLTSCSKDCNAWISLTERAAEDRALLLRCGMGTRAADAARGAGCPPRPVRSHERCSRSLPALLPHPGERGGRKEGK